MSISPRARTAILWTGIVLGVLVAALLLTVALIDWNSMRQPLERFASERSGRKISIEDLDVDVWTWTPKVTLKGLTIGNPPWEPAKPMVQVERVHAQLKLLALLHADLVLPRVELIRPRVYLHRDSSGRANWTFESKKPTNAPSDEPPDLPAVRDFLVQDGKLTLRDDIRHLEVEGTIHARENSTEDDPEAFRVQGQGKLNEQPFEMRITGGPLVNLDPDRPYPFSLAIAAGDIRISSKGSVRRPFDLSRYTLNVKASGNDLADLFYLTQLALPNTPPFQLDVDVERRGKKVFVPKLAGKVGQSDLEGNLTIDMTRKRPFVSGFLESKQLRLADLAAPLGAEPKSASTLQGKTAPAKPSKKGAEEAAPENARLFPDARLQVNRVRVMDANVRFRAQSIQTKAIPLKEVAMDIKLDQGVLSLAPFAFELPQGKLTGTAHIDARGDKPRTRLELRAQSIQLNQLKGKKPGATAPLGGALQARALFEGTGDSIHDFMADSNGRVTLVLPHGEVRAAFAELTGINVARGIGLLLKGDDERAEIRCGVAQFAVERGTMHAQNIVFDTQDVRITGEGQIRLGPEELDLAIKGEPKKLRLARLRTPVEINGHLLKPAIGIDTGKTLKQGAIAGALAVLTPIAAAIAFIDPGLEKDENCATLLAEAKKSAAKPTQLSQKDTAGTKR